ncbi:hypothetical protein [Methylobacterium sp. D54C]
MERDAGVRKRAGSPDLNLEEPLPAHRGLNPVDRCHHDGTPDVASDGCALQRAST